MRCEARAREPRREVGTLAQDEKRAASDQHFEREPRRESHGRRPETRHRWNIVWQAGDQRRGVAAPGCIVGCRLVVVAHRSASVSPSRSARRPIATVDPYPHRAGRDAGARSRYERLRTGRAGRAVAAVQNGACGACFRALAPAALQEARRRERLLSCDGCGRYLVLPPE